MTLAYDYLDTPVGRLLLAADATGLRRIAFPDVDGHPVPPQPGWRHAPAELAQVRTQLQAYFDGQRTAFDLPLAPRATPFQARVLDALRRIPYGATVSYGELAGRLGNPKASRAVGLANGRNPIPIVIPCHRVIGADGSLTGFGGGLPAKRYLLALEQRHASGGQLRIA